MTRDMEHLSGQPEACRLILQASWKDITELTFYNTKRENLKNFKSVKPGRLILVNMIIFVCLIGNI